MLISVSGGMLGDAPPTLENIITSVSSVARATKGKAAAELKQARE